MFSALSSVVPSHLMDRRHYDFEGLQVTGVADADGDKAFDVDALPQSPALAGLQVVRIDA
jgi:tRNA 2-thiocytidine biosynthesis protein TtcA